MLRTIFPSDIPRLLTIENAVHIAPWIEETFKTCFQAGYLGWAVELKGVIIGFIIVSITIDECHILNLCVDRANQHQGWGRRLLEHALAYAKQQGVGIAYLEVRESNEPAIALYKKMKFHRIGERKAYYPTVAGHEDALIFAISLYEDVSTP